MSPPAARGNPVTVTLVTMTALRRSLTVTTGTEAGNHGNLPLPRPVNWLRAVRDRDRRPGRRRLVTRTVTVTVTVAELENWQAQCILGSDTEYLESLS